jgi:hypothetical protein
MTASLYPPVQHMIVDLMLPTHALRFNDGPDAAHLA